MNAFLPREGLPYSTAAFIEAQASSYNIPAIIAMLAAVGQPVPDAAHVRDPPPVVE